MPTKYDARQVINRSEVRQLAIGTNKEQDNLNASIESEVTPPLYMRQSSTPNQVLNIGPSIITNPETGTNRSSMPIGSYSPSFTGATITLPSATGGNILISTGGSYLLTIGTSKFKKMLVTLGINGAIGLTLGTDQALLVNANAEQLSANVISGNIIGHFIIRTDASGVVQPVTDAYIYKYDTVAISDHSLMDHLDYDGHTQYAMAPLYTLRTVGTYSIVNTVVRDTWYNCDTSSGAITFNLAALSNFPNGYRIMFTKMTSDVNSVTINASGGELINQTNSITLSLVDTTVTLIKSNSKWESISSGSNGGSGGITGLILNNDSIPTTSVGSWLTYQDAAGVSPVDMTGGAPTITFTRNTSNPISSTADFLLTKDAANRQGQGVSLTLTSIPNKYKSRACIFRFKYSTSATYVENAVGIFIYDITGAVIYQMNPLYIKKSGLIESSFAEIQLPSTLTSGFRIGFHIIGTDTTAYTINFSEFSFDEKVSSTNSTITDWKSYTPQIFNTGAKGIASSTGLYRRIGDSAEIKIRFSLDSTASGSAAATPIQFTIPSGLTMVDDGVSNLGQATEYKVKTDLQFTSSLAILGTSSTAVSIINAGTNAFYQIKDVNIARTCDFYLEFKVKIAGWSSGTQISDIYTGRDISFRAIVTNSPTSTTIGNIVIFDTKRIDTTNSYNASTGVWTCPSPGKYSIKYNLQYNFGGTPPTQLLNWVRVNAGATRYAAANQDSTLVANKTFPLHGSCDLDLLAGDTIDVVTVSSGTTSTIYGTSTLEYSYLSIARIESANQVLAGEKVIEAYESSAGTSYANAANLIYGTKVKSTHGIYNVSTGEFIANKTGDLTIEGLFGSSNTNTATEIYIYVRKNGADYRVISDLFAPVSAKAYIKYGDKFPVTIGDSIFIRVSHNGTSMATAAFTFYNHVTFTLE